MMVSGEVASGLEKYGGKSIGPGGKIAAIGLPTANFFGSSRGLGPIAIRSR